jgi:hypothetical protein
VRCRAHSCGPNLQFSAWRPWRLGGFFPLLTHAYDDCAGATRAYKSRNSGLVDCKNRATHLGWAKPQWPGQLSLPHFALSLARARPHAFPFPFPNPRALAERIRKDPTRLRRARAWSAGKGEWECVGVGVGRGRSATRPALPLHAAPSRSLAHRHRMPPQQLLQGRLRVGSQTDGAIECRARRRRCSRHGRPAPASLACWRSWTGDRARRRRYCARSRRAPRAGLWQTARRQSAVRGTRR